MSSSVCWFGIKNEKQKGGLNFVVNYDMVVNWLNYFSGQQEDPSRREGVPHTRFQLKLE